MFTKLKSAAAIGLDSLPVDVEVDINKGQTNFSIVGLADTSIKEARERIYSAMKNSGFGYPFNFRILINLAPADLQKEGPIYDLPMAVGLIIVSQSLQINLDDALLVGELALDGGLRHTNGILPLAIFAKNVGLKKIFVPEANAIEAGMVEGIEVYPIKNLRQIIDHLTAVALIPPYQRTAPSQPPTGADHAMDMAMVKGQEFAKRALEIAAAGNHNVIMSGPPGSGKTLLARAVPSILPKLSADEILEITKIYSIAGLLNKGLIAERPFRSPHHTASAASLVGGGRVPRPGEISLAHRGVLFFGRTAGISPFCFGIFATTVGRRFGNNFTRSRHPLFSGQIYFNRQSKSLSLRIRLRPEQQCTCGANQVLNYKRKISGPLLDRVDLHVEVPRISFEKLSSDTAGEPSSSIRARVEKAREKQKERFKDSTIKTNGEMDNREIKKFCRLDEPSLELLRSAVNKMRLSARSYNRLLKVARTIADLRENDNICLEHIAEALQYRPKTE